MKRFRRVLLVNPPGTEQGGYTPSPMGILYLAAYLREKERGVDISVVDGAIEGEQRVVQAISVFRPDLVGVSSLTPGRHQALRVARLVKHLTPSARVVLGGIHPTLMWSQMMEFYPEIDYIVRGEGEVAFSELVLGKKLSEILGLVWRGPRNVVINNPNQPLIHPLDSLPFPAWDLIDPLKYPPRGEGIVNGIDLGTEVRFSLIFSRGCMAACTFCSSWKVWRGYRCRSGKNVAAEVEYLVHTYNAKHICFYDDTLTGNRREIINFCKEIVLKKLKLALFGTTRVDLVDPELLRWMKKAGFYIITYGIESGSPAMLLKINKRTDIEKSKRAVRLTKKAGIQAVALLMYGMPTETEGDRRLTKRMLAEIQPDGIGTLGEVWIFPGTELFEQAMHAGIIDERFWLGKRPHYTYRGGIGDDPINRKLQLLDTIKFTFTQLPPPARRFILQFKEMIGKGIVPSK